MHVKSLLMFSLKVTCKFRFLFNQNQTLIPIIYLVVVFTATPKMLLIFFIFVLFTYIDAKFQVVKKISTI